MNSLRQKITFGYYAVGTLIVGISVFAFVELRLIEQKILAGGMISEFFDTTLEIRRFEKNYFLFRQDGDLLENRRYLLHAQQLLRENRVSMETFASPSGIALLQDKLSRYAALMGEDEIKGGSAAKGLEGRIRKLGQGNCHRRRGNRQGQAHHTANLTRSAPLGATGLDRGIGSDRDRHWPVSIPARGSTAQTHGGKDGGGGQRQPDAAQHAH